MGYYTAALKGAATVQPSLSSSFKRLARLHYHAVELRRQGHWANAGEVYRRALALQEKLPPAKEVPKCAAAACSWLNLALTQKNDECFELARHSFQARWALRMAVRLAGRHPDGSRDHAQGAWACPQPLTSTV